MLGAFGRWVVAWFMGATLWAEYMPEVFLGMPMTNPWIYSAIYNAIYIVVSLALILVVIGIIYVPLKKYFLGEDIQRSRKAA